MMKLNRIFLIGSIAASLTASALSQNAAKAKAAIDVGVAIGAQIDSLVQTPCTRHFYNQSHAQWTVIGSEGSGFCEKAGCTVPAGQTAAVDYPIVAGRNVTLRIVGPNYDETYPVEQGSIWKNTGSCVYLRHSRGNTGNAVLNDPANGDVAMID